MKLPNGYGSVTKLSGNRRKPWLVRVSGKATYDEKRHDFVTPRLPLGYYATRKEALAALAEYNESPFNLADGNITFAQIYERYKKTKEYKKLRDKTIGVKNAAYQYCEPIYNIKIRDVNVEMLQTIIDNCPNGSATKKNIRTIMNTVLDYACKNNLISKNYADFIQIEDSDPVIDRIPFTKDEIDKLWTMSDQWDVKVLLILLYSGMRVNELLKNDRENVNLDERWVYVPKELAKNKESIRYVPIHDRTYPLVKWFYKNSEKCGSEKLMLNENGSVIAYNNFVSRNLVRINTAIGTTHKFHDTRHTFASRGTTSGIPELYMQRIMGHAPSSMLYSTYTHLTIQDLLEQINKIE